MKTFLKKIDKETGYCKKDAKNLLIHSKFAV